MHPFARWLATQVLEKVQKTASSGGELRLLFHGPPSQFLEKAFEILVDEAKDHPELPSSIVLLVPAGEQPVGDLPIGAPGRCDEDHLLELRNSRQEPSYVALVPPGQHAILSIVSTANDFGVKGTNNDDSVPFEVWWQDAFVQEAVSAGIATFGFAAEEEAQAREIVHHAAQAFDAVDDEPGSRLGAWRLVSRLHAAAGLDTPTTGHALSLACGVPPTPTGKLSFREQATTVEHVASALAEGFRSGLEAAFDRATDDEKGWLEAFRDHARQACDVPTALERGPEAYYAPWVGADAALPPSWWSGLTTEVWGNLLAEQPTQAEELGLECLGALLPPGKGLPAIVRDEVVLELRTQAGGTIDVNIERTPRRGTDGFPQGVSIHQGVASISDDDPPRHTSPIQYKVVAEGYRPASVKVVSLATWAPGLFVACRYARKTVAPRQARRRAGVEWEASLTLPGGGRYELMVFTSPGVTLGEEATGIASSGEVGDDRRALPVRLVESGLHQVEVDADEAYQVEISFTREATDRKPATETCRVSLAFEEVAEEGCRSEFERLIRSNRRRLEPFPAKAVVQLGRSERSLMLQGWMLDEESAGASFLPLVMAEDYGHHWVRPRWREETGRIFSSGDFLHDPRPPASAFQPSGSFVADRVELARMIRGADDQGVVESAPLGAWLLGRPEFREVLERYLDAYLQWLRASPEIACWVDAVVVTSLEPRGRTLARVPDAVLLSPLHPLKLAWHAQAQAALHSSAISDLPCPAASVMDPGCVPDILRMALSSPEGAELSPFLAVEGNSDYWTVLWNASRLTDLPKRSAEAPFDDAFGIKVGGIASGFSAGQVARALDDVAGVLCAKPTVSVLVSSAGGTTDACNEGLTDWSARRFGEGDPRDRRQAAGPRRLDVYDVREQGLQPDDAAIANLSEDTSNRVRWFNGQPAGSAPDLGIIAQLDSREPQAAETALFSSLGAGGLIRHRVRRQLPGAFLSESRQARAAALGEDPFADKISACIATMENLGDNVVGLRFAPNVLAIRDMVEAKHVEFVAISSSSVDPACFLGGWLEQAYLWDYDLPSYSHRAGDTNGYYLLSSVKVSDRDGIRRVLKRLPGCQELEDAKVDDILLEVARRGIPTIRGLSGDDTGASGDLGLFVASRLLQDRFRVSGGADSLMGVIQGTAEEPSISIVVPIDPFRGYLDDLAVALHKDRGEASLLRPDLVVARIAFGPAGTKIHLTPVEVKYRRGILQADEIAGALEQARALGSLLAAIEAQAVKDATWRVAYQHLLLSMLGFGMRVYSQHQDLAAQQGDWSVFHERIASAILGQPGVVSIDKRGRVIVVDETAMSDAYDKDRDGFDETIVVGQEDAGRIVAGDAQAFYDMVKSRVGDWGLAPPVGGPPAANPLPQLGDPSVADAPALVEGDAPSSTEASAAEVPTEAHVDDGEARREEQLVLAPQADVQGNRGITLEVGTTLDGFEKRTVTLALSDTRLNQLNMGVVGDLGTGKTQLLKSLVYQIAGAGADNRGIQPRMLIFDYKRDYSSPDFVAATGARVVKPHRLPFNLFDTSSIGDSMVPWLDRFRFFADVLDKIYSGIGPVQRDKLKRATRAAYEAQPSGAPTIYDIHAAYQGLLEGRSDSPMAIIDDLVDMEIFEPDPSKAKPFSEFLDGIVVVSLDALGQDDRSKNMLVAVMLNLFYEEMLRTPKRPFLGTDPQLRAIDSYLLVDEADNIMRYEFDVLRKLLLQGREFGTGVILASQYLRHFKVNATDYREPLLTWFVHKVPNVTAAELSALGLAGAAGEIAERVKGLGNHQCLYKSFDSPGRVVRGMPFYELLARQGQE